MPTLKIPALMKSYAANQTEILLQGSNLREVVNHLVIEYPTIRPHILDANGAVRRYINFYVNGVHIRDLNGENTQVSPEDKIILLPSISGG